MLIALRVGVKTLYNTNYLVLRWATLAIAAFQTSKLEIS